MVKKKRNKNDESFLRTGEAVVVSICQIVVDKDRNSIIVLLQLLLEYIDLVERHLQARPPIPLKLRCLGQAAETAHETPRGHGGLIFALARAGDGDGQPI